jgi:hypothetical protein
MVVARREATVNRPRTLAALVGDMLASPPGQPAAEKARAALEHAMMVMLQDGHQARLDAAIRGIEEPRFTHFRDGALTRWSATLPDGRRLELQSIAGEIVLTSNVVYEPATAATPALPNRRHRLQQQFYERYMAVGQRVYNAKGRVRTTPEDRLILLVGELEADVNNGGFDQYLLNKGRRRARAALEALQGIGARKTARMLEKALRPGVTPEELSALDERFYEVPEDLAVATMRAIARRRGSPRRLLSP